MASEAASSRLNQGTVEGAAATTESMDTGAVGGTDPRGGKSGGTITTKYAEDGRY